MRSLKLLSAVVVLPVLLLFGCGDKDPTSPAPNPVGTWSFTLTFNYEGTDLAMICLNEVKSDKTYQMTGHITDGTTTVTVTNEQGTWNNNGTTVTFTPSSCMMYDNSTDQLEVVSCDGPSNFVLNGDNTQMTDGTITMVKQ
jgi:hypothetical protein